MLNDLFAIERGLTAHGIPLADRHPDIKDMARGSAFWVRLHADGCIASVEIVPESVRGALWTLRDGQKNGFPGLRTGSGLLSLSDQARNAHAKTWNGDKAPTSRRSELLRLLKENPVDKAQMEWWPELGHRKRIAERLEILRPLADDPLTASVPAAFERFLAALNTTPSLLEGLIADLAERVRDRGDEWLDPARTALVGPVVLVIDVPDSEFQRDAVHHRQIGSVSLALGSTSVKSNSPGSRHCAFTGQNTNLHRGNYPEPNLPSLGQVKLFSRNPDIPSLRRFGMLGDSSFPIAAHLLGRLAAALKALTAAELQNRTWRRVPGERLVTQDGKKVERWDLMIASLPAAPDVPLAGDMAGDDEEDETVTPENAFKELAKRVVGQSRGHYEHDNPQEEVIVLILRRIDKGNHKVIYHRRTTSAEFWRAAQRWQKATSNAPEWIGFPCPIKGKTEAVVRRPPYVAPLSITPLSRIRFANEGRRRLPVIGVTAAEAFGLFLHEGDVERRARAVLRLLLERHTALLSTLSRIAREGRDGRGKLYLESFDPKADLRRYALRSTTWIGALLHHLGYSKEVFMSSAGFRLGQLLAAADVVHVGYCLDVRKGSIPSSLLGNAILTRAASHPQGALKLLLRRWPPYAAWAKNPPRVLAEAAKADKSKAISLRKALSQAQRIGPIAAELGEQLRPLDGKTDDVFQAELLLGYMAGLPSTAKQVDVLLDSEDDETNEGADE